MTANERKERLIAETKGKASHRGHIYDNRHFNSFVHIVEQLLEESGKKEGEYLQDIMLANLIIYNQIKAEFYNRNVFTYGDLYAEDDVLYHFCEKKYDIVKFCLDYYMKQINESSQRRYCARKFNTLINNFLSDVVKQYKVEKPDSENEFYWLLPFVEERECDVSVNCYMKYAKYFNYGFFVLPSSAETNPKEYFRQIVHQIFRYTPIHCEVERNNLFVEMVSVSILGTWRTVLNNKVNNGEIERTMAEDTYKLGLNTVKKFLIESMCKYTRNEEYGIINPMLLTIMSTYCIYRMHETKFLAMLEGVNRKIIYSSEEEKRIMTRYWMTADRRCISINNFLSEIYGDIYMSVLCDVTPLEYIKLMASSSFFAKEPKATAGDTSILRFGFMCKKLFNSKDWREKTCNVLKELYLENNDEEFRKRLENLEQYLEVYNEILGTDQYIENAVNDIAEKWQDNAREIKVNCCVTLENLKNFEDVEPDIIDKIETLNNAMYYPDPTISDIRIVRAIDKRCIPSYSYMPHVLYAETMEDRNYHRMFETTFSEQMVKYDADYVRCDLRANVCG